MTVLLTCILLLLTPEARDSLLAETPGNQAFWKNALKNTRGCQGEAVEYLFETIPRLDRLEMTEESLMDHVQGAMAVRSEFYDSLPDSMFFEYLVSYRIDEEPVAPYRAELREFWASRIETTGNPAETALEIASWISVNVEIFQYDYLGGIADPLSIIGSGGGTPGEHRVLLCASLKALGIAARPVIGWFSGEYGGSRRWIEVWNGNSWIPVVSPTDSIPGNWAGLALAIVPGLDTPVTAEYRPAGILVSSPLEYTDEEQFTAVLNIPVKGKYLPLDYLWLSTSLQDTVELGEGEYILMVSSRRNSGLVDMWLHNIDIRENDTTAVDLSDSRYALTPLP